MLADTSRPLKRFGFSDLARGWEHKAEHNNCRMRGTCPDVETSKTMVSA